MDRHLDCGVLSTVAQVDIVRYLYSVKIQICSPTIFLWLIIIDSQRLNS